MFTRVRIRNFKAIEELQLSLERLTVLVGPNGSGKTSVLEAIHTLGAFYTGELGRYQRRKSADPVRIELDDPARSKRLSSADHILGTLPAPTTSFLQLSPRQLAAPAYSEEEVPTLQPDGSGLGAVIADLAASAPDLMVEIVQNLRQVVPAVRRVRAERAKITRAIQQTHVIDGQRVQVQKQEVLLGHRVVLDTTSGDGIPAEHISEGTLLVLGLLTFLCGRTPPHVLLLDDMDRALHPKAQADLVAVLRRLLDARPELQIVATTHSPYLLDELRFEEVRLLTLRPDGTVASGSLTEHPDYEQWKDNVRPGELWTSRLEAWLLDRPAFRGGMAWGSACNAGPPRWRCGS